MRETEGACAAEEARRPSTKGARAAEGARKPKEARRLELRDPRTVLEEQISELEARIKQREEQIETLGWWPGSRWERQPGELRRLKSEIWNLQGHKERVVEELEFLRGYLALGKPCRGWQSLAPPPLQPFGPESTSASSARRAVVPPPPPPPPRRAGTSERPSSSSGAWQRNLHLREVWRVHGRSQGAEARAEGPWTSTSVSSGAASASNAPVP